VATSKRRLMLADRRSGTDELLSLDDLEGRYLTHHRALETTVRQPTMEKGVTAAELLVQLVNRAVQPRHVVLPTHLIERQWVGSSSANPQLSSLTL
jgi:hypothetical protein